MTTGESVANTSSACLIGEGDCNKFYDIMVAMAGIN
jgi:hypothetical protein